MQKAFYSNSTSLRYRQLFFEKIHECGLVGKLQVGVIGLIKIIALTSLTRNEILWEFAHQHGNLYGTIDSLVRYVIYTKTCPQMIHNIVFTM